MAGGGESQLPASRLPPQEKTSQGSVTISPPARVIRGIHCCGV